MTDHNILPARESQHASAYQELGHWPDEPLGEYLHHCSQRWPQKTALVCGPQRMSYQQLDNMANRLAAGFAARGIKAGDNILIQMPNSLGMIGSLFALFRLGARPILAMPGQKSADIDALCALAQPKAWLFPNHFLGNDYRKLAQHMAEKHPSMQQWMIDSQQDPLALMLNYQRATISLPTPQADDIALLLLSGGSTGTPKLIPRTHADYYYNARQMSQLCQLNSESVYLASLAVAHNFTLACPGVLGTLLVGGTVVLAQTSGCDEVFPLIEREKVTITALVPPLVRLWLECREWDDSDLSSLKILQVGGARLESDMAARVTPSFGCTLQQVFGMAEGLICCTRLDDPESVILHTQGRPISAQDKMRIVDEFGSEVSKGMSGELLTRGPYTISGYYRADQQNRDAFTQDGYYRSGDCVRLTAEGNVVVEGRLKEQINRAGEKIATVEIETLISRHPAISSCEVVGVKDTRLGERICACIQPIKPVLLAELRQFLQQQQLSSHKLPDQLLFVSSWPLTAVGKIDKRKLAVLAQQAIEQPEIRQTMDYFQAEIPLTAAPLDVCYRLLATGWRSHIAYERGGHWTLGLDHLAQVQLFPQHAQLTLNGLITQSWQDESWLENLQQAIAALPFKKWRALGVGRFELAYLFHQLAQTPDDNIALLELHIPRYEVDISEGTAQLRARSEQDLINLYRYVIDADKSVDIAQPDPNWLAQIEQQIHQQDAQNYCDRVAKAIAEIAQGDYQKVILSRRIHLHDNIDLAASYHLGRRHNTPARSFSVDMGQQRFIGFSPETVVEVSASGEVSTQPLAGTRALTADKHMNAALREVLVNDTKEIAEHAVSVKLAFEELQTFCQPESVRVTEFMQVSPRGSVQHLASRLCGRMATGFNIWHALCALFPAVTASGIPKRPALDAIARHEPCLRGAYSGSVITLDSEGAFDAALILRSLYQIEGGYAIQAGAGIINQSHPERELAETIEKLQSVSRYLVQAG